MIYVITEDSSFFNKIKTELGELYPNSEFVQSLPIPRPSDPNLLDIWGQRIIQVESDRLCSDVVVFDFNCTDKVGLYFMLGMRLNIGGSKGVILYNSDLDISEFRRSISTVQSNIDSDNIDIYDKMILGFNTPDIKIDLDERSFYNLIILGYHYDNQDIILEGSKINPIFNTITKIRLKNEN